jgi:hypothetical protein
LHLLRLRPTLPAILIVTVLSDKFRTRWGGTSHGGTFLLCLLWSLAVILICGDLFRWW